MGELFFFNGRNGIGAALGSMDDSPGQAVNFLRNGPIPNDEAQSLRLSGVRAGCIIKLFDHPRGSLTADWCQIEVLKCVPEYIVPTFEHRYSDEYVRVVFFHKNGLDGRVSRVEID